MAVETTVLFKVGDLYGENMKHVRDPEVDVIVNQGGTSSAKTYTILQILFTIASEYKFEDVEGFRTCIITIVGQDIPNLKRGALRQALEIVDGSPVLQSLIASYNKTDRVFTFRNGAKVEFNSYVDAHSAKSGKRQYLFINEANGIDPSVYNELYWRCDHKTFIDYNPNSEFWVHEQVIGSEGARLIISDHRHNPFLTEGQHKKIEGIPDRDLWQVYARGRTGKIEGLVFRNWHLSAVPDHAKLVAYGMDFGFTNDPTTLVGVYQADGELYTVEYLYETNLTTTDIHNRLIDLEINPKHKIVADSADPKTIEELGRLGWNTEAAKKGPDSIVNGIDILKRYVVNMTVGSMNLRKEIGAYKWKTDRNTGKPLNEPVDAMNHLIDPVRYVALNCLSVATSYKPANFGFRKRTGRRAR